MNVTVVIIMLRGIVSEVMAFASEDDAIEAWERATNYSWKKYIDDRYDPEKSKDFNGDYEGSDIYAVLLQ